MNFPPRSSSCIPRFARVPNIVRGLAALGSIGLVSCQSSAPDVDPSSAIEVTAAKGGYSAEWKKPDSMTWAIGDGPHKRVSKEVIEEERIEARFTIPSATTKDIVVGMWTLGIRSVVVHYTQTGADEMLVVGISVPDAVAMLLLEETGIGADHRRDTLRARYVRHLVAGDSAFKGYPGNCPVGLEPTEIDSLILMRVISSKDSVGKVGQNWALPWTLEKVKETYRRWLAGGVIRQGQYDTLYPFDDRPPTMVKPLVFTGGTESNAIQRGTDGVQLEGSFADDSGMVADSLRILSKTGEDVTKKFAITKKEFPNTPQKAWSLKGQISIKADEVPTDLYTMELSFKDRKNQTVTAKLAFSVYPLGGVAIDSLAPVIVVANPVAGIDTVSDTTRSYLVRFALSDLNLKTVVLGLDTVKPLDGVVEKTVALTEGKETLVRIWANDSAGNRSKDSARIFRKVAVLPKVTPNHPATRRDTVPDTTYTYSFRWQVEGVDIDSIRIDTFGVLLDNQKIAEKTLPLKLGGTTRVKIRVVDKLHHQSFDSMDVVRGSSVAPAVSRVGVPAGVVTVPDTQSYYTANWLVLDNNLQTVQILGQPATLTNSKCGATVFLKAGDTARVTVWAQDKLGSIGTDTVKVWRPDPRTPYLADIQKVQHGDSVVPLTDFILPNVRFGRFEVTADLYAKVMKTTAPPSPGLPVTNVNVYDAMLFCNALSKSVGLDTFYTYTSRDPVTGYFQSTALTDTMRKAGALVTRMGYRLPTDLEWQTAAIANQDSYPWGKSTDPKVVDQYAAWNSTAAGIVGMHLPTGNGLFDLAGNVMEWVYRKNGADQPKMRWFANGGDATSQLGGLIVPNPDFEAVAGTTTSTLIGFRVVRVGSF